MQFHYGHATGDDQALDMGIAHALVKLASQGVVPEAIRIYRPAAPTVAFGRRDTHLPGFPAAARAAAAAGFRPIVRPTGGRAVAYTSDSIVIDHVKHDADVLATHEYRFKEFGTAFVKAFRHLGLDARMGAVHAEYCPGPYSVNARGIVKLVGTSQRILQNAWLFSSLVILADSDRLKAVLQDVYGELGLDFDPASVGAMTEAGSGPSADAVEHAILEHFNLDKTHARNLSPEVLTLGQRLSDDSRIP